MKIEFLGTRGYIAAKTNRHRRHSSAMIHYRGKRVMIDCGEDWLGQLQNIRPRPHAIIITHAHPDHSFGLADGAPCPVYATGESWESLEDYPIEKKKTVKARKSFKIGGITCEAFQVVHSLRAPAVGYRITAGKVTVFYVPDVVYIPERNEALEKARIYIGDGATLKRSFVRKKQGKLFGHTPVQTQLTWCRKENVPQAIITHLGSEIVKGDERKIGAELRRMAEERDVEALLAYDGLEIVLR